jgi:glycosyltransferase involved in cell wall biosynthesis
MHTGSTADLPDPAFSGSRPTLRILHLTISFARGGRRDAISTLAASLKPLGVESHLATLRGNAEETTPFTHQFASVEHWDIHGLPSVRQVARIRQFCNDQQISVVHAHDAASQFVASMLHSVVPSLQVVMTFHRSLGFESSGWRNRLRNAISLPLVARVLTASAERRDHFLRENLVSGQKVQVIPLGVDQSRFTPDAKARQQIRSELAVGADTPILVAMGHFGAEKGIDQVLRAAGDATRRLGPGQFHLAILGAGDPERTTLLHQLAATEVGSAVTFLGHRPDPERWLAGADLLIHLPRLEAFGLVVVQAMSCGTPVLASAVGGLPEIVLDAETGQLVDGTHPATAGAALADLVTNPELRLKLGQAALSRARDQYSDQRCGQRHLALYQQITSGHRARK